MGYIYYQLNNAANMGTMVPAAMPGGLFGVAALPAGLAGAGIYIIINTQGGGAAHNRYIGISTNLAGRFAPRMSVVTELGFNAATMNNINVVWGTVKVRNHPLVGGTPTAVTPMVNGGPPPTMPFPTWAAPGWAVAAPAGGAFNVMIDGNNVNLEHLLIRFVMMRLGAGGTVSNNMLMAPYAHPNALGAPGAHPLFIKFHSAGFGPYNGYTVADALNPGFVI